MDKILGKTSTSSGRVEPSIGWFMTIADLPLIVGGTAKTASACALIPRHQLQPSNCISASGSDHQHATRRTLMPFKASTPTPWRRVGQG